MYLSSNLWWVWPSRLRRQIVVLETVGSIPTIHPIILLGFKLASASSAGMAELADALDLGSSVIDVGVQVLFPAPDDLVFFHLITNG